VVFLTGRRPGFASGASRGRPTRRLVRQVTLTPDVNYVGLNPKGTKLLNKDFGFSNGVFAYGGSTQLLESTFSPEEIAFQKVMTSRRRSRCRPVPRSRAASGAGDAVETPLKDYVTQNALNVHPRPARTSGQGART